MADIYYDINDSSQTVRFEGYSSTGIALMRSHYGKEIIVVTTSQAQALKKELEALCLVVEYCGL